MRLRPRYYQSEATAAGIDFLNTTGPNEAGLIAMPTGTGKAMVIAMLCEQLLQMYPWLRIQCLTHVKELVGQNHAELLELWPLAPAGINSAGLKRRDHGLPIIFGGIGSVCNNPAVFGHVHLLIVDECDTMDDKATTRYVKYITALRLVNPQLRVIGLSATIWRQKMGLLTNGKLFTRIIYDITGTAAYNKLVREGYLARITTKETAFQYDTDGLRTGADGDFASDDMEKRFDDDRLTRVVLEEVVYHGRDRQSWLLFCSGNHHADRTAAILRSMGIGAKAVHTGKTAAPRDETVRELKAGTIRAVTNNNVLTVGFNAPGIDLLVWMRATRSSRLFVQGNGRGTRPVFAPGYDLLETDGRLAAIAVGSKPHGCLALDFAGNIDRCGPINDPVIPDPKRKRRGTAPVKKCPKCSTKCHASVRFCENVPECDYEFPKLNACEKLSTVAGMQPFVRDDKPAEPEAPSFVIEPFDVTGVVYAYHMPRREGAIASMRVTYQCGLRSFDEWVCVGHPEGSSARNMAIKWWTDRVRVLLNDRELIADPPPDVSDAIAAADTLPMPRRIHVWLNHPSKHPQVHQHEFTQVEPVA